MVALPQYKSKNILSAILLLLLALLLGIGFVHGGLIVPVALAVLPFGIIFLGLVIAFPRIGIHASLIFGFFANGITRYIDGPFGLLIDIFLLLAALGIIFRTKTDEHSPGINSKLTWVVGVWFCYTIIQIVNPEARSFAAWFYAVRGVSLYFMATILLTFVLLYREKDCNNFITTWFICSLIGSLWGFKQFFIGLDTAENAWLEGGAKITHILFGQLRIFSFYSDAGQFGAAQAHTGVVASILALGPVSRKRKWFYILTALLSFYSMSISGTRGAMFVAIMGFFIYFVLSNNMKILIPGIVIGSLVFGLLKFTNIGQNNDQIRRMRTAMDPNDASFQVRLENQAKLRVYLASRPLGGGIGSAGSWGQRFSPGSFLAETPLDSWYVKIWAESGVIGLWIYVLMLLFILVNRFIFIFRIHDPDIKQKMAALYGGVFGICVASYGNQIFGQLPTGNVMYLSLVYLFLAEHFIEQRKVKNLDRTTG